MEMSSDDNDDDNNVRYLFEGLSYVNSCDNDNNDDEMIILNNNFGTLPKNITFYTSICKFFIFKWIIKES